MANGVKRRLAAVAVIAGAMVISSCGSDSTDVSSDDSPRASEPARLAVYLESGTPETIIEDFVFGAVGDPERKIQSLVFDEMDRAVEVVAVPGASLEEVLDDIRRVFQGLDIECVAEVDGPQSGDVPPRDDVPSGACRDLG